MSPTTATWNGERHCGGYQRQFSFSVPDVMDVQDWPLTQAHGHSSLIGVRGVGDRVSAAGAQPFASDFGCASVRDGLKVACPDQPCSNAVLPIDDRNDLPVRAGLHAERGEQIRFCRESILAAAFAAHHAHKSTSLFLVYKLIVSSESSFTRRAASIVAIGRSFKAFAFPSQQFAIAQSVAQKNAVRNIRVDHDRPFHHDGAMGVRPPKAKHNEIAGLRRVRRFPPQTFQFPSNRVLLIDADAIAPSNAEAYIPAAARRTPDRRPKETWRNRRRHALTRA